MFHRTRLFLAAYRYLPHRALNRTARFIAEREPPLRLVSALIALWAKHGGIDLSEADGAPYRSLQEFFLRSLKPGTRPLGDGFVSPVDGTIIACGPISRDREVSIKGHALSLARVLDDDAQFAALQGGSFCVVFLSPADYHHIHMPISGRVLRVRSIAGRYFPQNEVALGHIARVYERNERAVLACTSEQGLPFALVLVGASLVGGIHLDHADQAHWLQPRAVSLDLALQQGQRLGHFAFGSTVVALVPAGYAPARTLRVGRHVKFGQTLFEASVQEPAASPT